MAFACTIAEVTPSLYDAVMVGWFIHPHTIETFHLDMESNMFIVHACICSASPTAVTPHLILEESKK